MNGKMEVMLAGSDRLRSAIMLAVKAHEGQTRADKDKTPYISHCYAVAGAGDTESEMILGMVHDIAEDTEYTIDDIASMVPLTPEEIEILILLTRAKEETELSYGDYIRSICRNKTACKIKLADLKHNQSSLMNSTFSFKKKEKLKNRYERAVETIMHAMNSI